MPAPFSEGVLGPQTKRVWNATNSPTPTADIAQSQPVPFSVTATTISLLTMRFRPLIFVLIDQDRP